MRFRKKPVVIDAIQWTGENVNEITELADPGTTPFEFIGGRLYVVTLEGRMAASVGDWIIRGIAGELYPCKPDIFKKTYEPAGRVARRTSYTLPDCRDRDVCVQVSGSWELAHHGPDGIEPAGPLLRLAVQDYVHGHAAALLLHGDDVRELRDVCDVALLYPFPSFREEPE